MRNGRVEPPTAKLTRSMMGLLGLYSMETPGTTVLGRVTLLLGPRARSSPTVALLIDPESGGWTRDDPGGRLLVGSPELVVEVADGTLEIDLNAKKARL